MFGALWRVLRGPRWVRLLVILAIVAAYLAVLAFWVFPWVQATWFAPVDITIRE